MRLSSCLAITKEILSTLRSAVFKNIEMLKERFVLKKKNVNLEFIFQRGFGN